MDTTRFDEALALASQFNFTLGTETANLGSRKRVLVLKGQGQVFRSHSFLSLKCAKLSALRWVRRQLMQEQDTP